MEDKNTLIFNESIDIIDKKVVNTSLNERNIEDITKIIIPDSVTCIHDRVFFGCKSLISLEIGNKVTRIGKFAFFGCKSLTSLKIGNNVTNIGYSAFNGCESLTSLEIGNMIKRISMEAFSGCNSLISLEIPDNVDKISEAAFLGCKSLTSLKIGNKVTLIDKNAFTGCNSLISLELPDNVTNIRTEAFSGCKSLKYVICHIKDIDSDDIFQRYDLLDDSIDYSDSDDIFQKYDLLDDSIDYSDSDNLIIFTPDKIHTNIDMGGFDFTGVTFPVGTHFGQGCSFNNNTNFTGADLTNVTIHESVKDEFKKTNIHDAKVENNQELKELVDVKFTEVLQNTELGISSGENKKPLVDLVRSYIGGRKKELQKKTRKKKKAKMKKAKKKKTRKKKKAKRRNSIL